MKRSITKALCLVCAGALALGAAGCSKSDSSSSASSEAASSVLGSAADYDYQNFTYSDGLDENGYWEGIRALDYVTLPEDYASIPVQRADVEPTSATLAGATSPAMTVTTMGNKMRVSLLTWPFS